MIDPNTQTQLDKLEPISRPLLVCDVDEVILHLVEPFEKLLRERGMELRKKLVKLQGNVFNISDGSEASQEDIWQILNQLFDEQAERQSPVEGACDVMAELASDFDIVLLTNLPHEFGDIRRRHLENLGIPYPLVTNSGLKGPPMEWLNTRSPHKMAFMDDTHHHLESVREFAPQTFIVHFMADDTFRKMTKPLDPPVVSTGNWRDAGNAVRAALC